jgi:hypothetical protein
MLALLREITPEKLETVQAMDFERWEHEQQLRRWKAAIRSFPDQREETEKAGREELGDDLFARILQELQDQKLL